MRRRRVCLMLACASIATGCTGRSEELAEAAASVQTGQPAQLRAESAATGASSQPAQVVVNTVALSDEALAQLRRLYPVPIAPGRYWYDAVSGAYGIEGGPVVGQMAPGLQLGGPLQADASNGTSRVFINSRELTDGEKAYIEVACQTPVMPGRYWVDARGVGGFEGAPASFNLSLCGPPQGQSSGGSSTRTFCDPDGSCRSTGILGSILTTP